MKQGIVGYDYLDRQFGALRPRKRSIEVNDRKKVPIIPRYDECTVDEIPLLDKQE